MLLLECSDIIEYFGDRLIIVGRISMPSSEDDLGALYREYYEVLGELKGLRVSLERQNLVGSSLDSTHPNYI